MLPAIIEFGGLDDSRPKHRSYLFAKVIGASAIFDRTECFSAVRLGV